MRPLAIVGVLLIVLGIAALAVRTFSFTTQEKVVDVGPLHATADKEHSIFISPVAGVVAIVAGGALVFASRRRT